MRVGGYRVVEVVSFPRPLDAEVLYVSERFSAAAHACACGCGREVITPLSPVQWQLRRSTRGASLRPSIGNWNFPCRSHYWITDGRVEWDADMSDQAVKAGRAFNARLRERYFEEESTRELQSMEQPPAASPEPKRGLLARLMSWLID